MAQPSFLNRHFFTGLAIGIVAGVGVALLAGLAFAWVMTSSRTGLAAPPFPAPDAISIVADADPAWQMDYLEGGEVVLGDLRGQVVFLNLWATWCGPCVVELPTIQKLSEALDGEDVTFLLVSNEDASTVLDFLESRQLDLPVALSSAKDVPQAFRARGIPATYIIDREGRIVFRHVGAALWDDPASLEFIRGLL